MGQLFSAPGLPFLVLHKVFLGNVSAYGDCSRYDGKSWSRV